MDCQTSVERVHDPLCPICGEPQPTNQICSDCIANPPAFQAARAFGIYGGALKEAIHQLKYKGNIGLGESLSKHMIELYNDLQWDIDLIVPVPLSTSRLKARGYNQSELVARPLAWSIHKPLVTGALKRTRETQAQARLTAQERQQNVQGAFLASPKDVFGKVVLVIDDVTTTGSTISACAQALSAAGASATFGLTLARAVLQSSADDLPDTIS